MKRSLVSVCGKLAASLFWLCLAGSATAQESVDTPPAAASAPLGFGQLQAGPPIRQGYAYQIDISLSVSNPGILPSPETELVFVYTTVTGERYTCLNQTLPTSRPDGVYLNSMLPGAMQTMRGYLLIPAGWYRGQGTLGVGLAGSDAALTEVELVLY